MGVFLYDLIRATRRSRLVLLRLAYAYMAIYATTGVWLWRWACRRFEREGHGERRP